MEEKILERLQQIALLQDFKDDRDRLEKFYKIMKVEKFHAGDMIIKEGELGDKLYILNNGTVRILRSTLSSDNYTVALLKSEYNIFFGEVALIDSDKRSATVIAEDPCEVLSVRRNEYLKFCEANPLMGFKITLQIAKRISASLRKMNQDVITLFEALVSEVEGDFF